jgi:hypothetical protein
MAPSERAHIGIFRSEQSYPSLWPYTAVHLQHQTCSRSVLLTPLQAISVGAESFDSGTAEQTTQQLVSQ